MATTYYGIDVSVHNGYVDYSKVKKSKSFVMIRAGYGKYASQKDTRFEENYKNAKANGLHVGAYWYSYAHTTADALAEAKTFLSVIAGKQFDMPIAFDIEESFQASMSASLKSQIIDTFCSYCEKAGYFVQLYSFFVSSAIFIACIYIRRFPYEIIPVFSTVFGIFSPIFRIHIS